MLYYDAATGTHSYIYKQNTDCGFSDSLQIITIPKSRAGERRGQGDAQMIPPKVSSICDDRCDRLHSVASNSTMT